jgi:DNA-binding NarL/FixJ family response regulator
MIESIQILIADDHPLFRKGMAALLSSLPGLEVVGEAANGEEVIALAQTLQPNIILMDIQLPLINGIDATRQLLQINPHIKILMVTMFEDDASIFAAMRAGARGYLLKGADQSEVIRAIHAVSNGEAIFSPSIAQRFINYFATLEPDISTHDLPELTSREREILILMTQGLSNNQITEQLVLSSKTVRNHISNIFSKLQVVDRAQAILLARRVGLK